MRAPPHDEAFIRLSDHSHMEKLALLLRGRLGTIRLGRDQSVGEKQVVVPDVAKVALQVLRELWSHLLEYFG